MKLTSFKENDFVSALKELFNVLNVPLNYVTDKPTTAKELLKDTYKDNDSFSLMDDVYFLGMVDDAAFDGNRSLEIGKIKSDYDGILIFGVKLKSREGGLLPTRSQLAEISRAFNREFYYTPVVVVFKYDNHLAFANTERLKYKQEWREGEKAGKVTLLRDINIEKPHSGHLRILNELSIPVSGTNRVDSFSKLYTYWQEVFNVNILNKKFYQELSSWYFWAIKNVTFPGKPTSQDTYIKKAKIEDLVLEHNATNVIRMLTRLLFVWFIKEKKLIPEELFELETLQKEILKDISPYHETKLFKESNKDSIYYKAILQNLFFATLNCPIEGDSLDKRKRGFRGEGYGTHRGIDYLMRYKQYFKDPDKFLETLNKTVPFLNGGLFECLDDKFNNVYIDGFSDQMAKGEQLVVPDYLFFGVEEQTDISDVVGITDKKYKNAAVKGLINILKSYKFTITENTPIEEDVALDPELLGKVFENLLASYNPETRTTARKQTGSFYTPREIVNYMVDESLIAYLQSSVDSAELSNEDLKTLTSFDSKNPFSENPALQKQIIAALSKCTIVDPACGSGAFPMGVLQKMVHILQKLDSENILWKDIQLLKAEEESKAAFEIADKHVREERLLEINNAFDQSINDPDYARKLFLIENCIYGIDIQPIATQISKLRFFISLVVEQKVNPTKENFGIRPLPNLETKFVAANTLQGIEKPSKQLNLYDTKEVKALEIELKVVRHKLFSAKSKDTKLKYRQRDEELRKAIALELEKTGWKPEIAQNLAAWDPYDQNGTSPFFDPEWMFDISEGFDIVIGNPPYVQIPKGIYNEEQYPYSEGKDKGKQNLYKVFVEGSKALSKPNTGTACLIVQSSLLCDLSSTYTREMLLKHSSIIEFVEFPKTAPTKAGQVFENVLQGTCIYRFINSKPNKNSQFKISINNDITTVGDIKYETVLQSSLFDLYPETLYIPLINKGDFVPILEANRGSKKLSTFLSSISQGDINLTTSKDYFEKNDTGVKLYRGKNVQRFYLIEAVDEYVNKNFQKNKVIQNREQQYIVCQEITGTTDKYRLHFSLANSKSDFLFGHTANKLLLKDKAYNKTMVVLLNSKLLDWLFRKTSTNNHVMGYEINQFPIPVDLGPLLPITDFFHDVLHYLSKEKKEAKATFENVMNALVYNLYFPEHMRDRDINVSDYISDDISRLTGGRLFESLDNVEKDAIVLALTNKWSHPDSEVRNRIKLFAIRSPEILKPILEK